MDYIDNIDIMSEEEFAEYDNTKVASYIIDKIKRRGKMFFRQRAMITSIKKIMTDLKENEEIEAYITGRDIKTNNARIGIALFAPKYAAYNMGDWGSNVTIIKTNERIVLLSTNNYGEYLKHVFIDTVDPIQMYITPNGCRISVEMNSGELKLIDVNKERIDTFREALGNYKYKVNNKMIKTSGEVLFGWFIVFSLIGAGIIFVLLIKEGYFLVS